MKKLIKIILGAAIALITTVSLHINVDQPFHDRGFRYLGHPTLYGQHNGKHHPKPQSAGNAQVQRRRL